jgi:hypothetical protein
MAQWANLVGHYFSLTRNHLNPKVHVVNRMIITHMDPYGLIAPPNGLTKALGDAVPLKYQ